MAFGSDLGIDAETEPENGTVDGLRTRKVLQNARDELRRQHQSSVGCENALCDLVHFIQTRCAYGSLQLAESDALDLADALPRDVEVLADLLERLLSLPREGEAPLDHLRLLLREYEEQISEQLLKIQIELRF